MSKGYSLAGLRFGYAIAAPAMIAGLLKVKDSYNVDALAITAATAAIEDQTSFKLNIEKVKAERSRLTTKLRQLGFNAADSFTNFILAQNCQAGNIYKKLVQRNIYVRYFNLPGLTDKIRITVSTSEQNDKLLKALKEILSDQGAC